MMAAVKLAWPLLRSATAWWYFWPFVLLWAWLAAWDPRPELSFAASAGGCALLIIAGALGINLKRCRSRGLVRVLPGFQAQFLLAAGGLLFSLAVLLAVLDGWRSESLLALVTAAALGLGAGLSIPSIWILLLLAVWGAVIWVTTTGLALADFWSSAWSPWLAGLWLTLGLVMFRTGWLSGPRFVGEDGWQGTAGKRNEKSRGRQPYCMGRLLNPWPTIARFLLVNCLLLLWLGYVMSETATGLSAEPRHYVAGYSVMLAGVGVFVMLTLLLGPGRPSLRPLAVLPGWSRSRLFLHAERSAWRACLVLVLVLAPVLLLASLWAGEFNKGLWGTAIAFLGGLMAVGIYAALWIMREPNANTRMVVMMVAFFPALLPASAYFMQEGGAQATSPTALVVALAAAALLAGWLRRSARAAWASISFGRET